MVGRLAFLTLCRVALSKKKTPLSPFSESSKMPFFLFFMCVLFVFGLEKIRGPFFYSLEKYRVFSLSVFFLSYYSLSTNSTQPYLTISIPLPPFLPP